MLSSVYNLLFICQMESKISEANTHIIIFGWCENILKGISFKRKFSLMRNPKSKI